MAKRWAAVVGYEGIYEVSRDGKVRSLDREMERGSKWGGIVVHRFKGRTLRGWKMNGDYRYVGLRSRDGKSMKTIGVHCLVLEAFVGPCPKGMECRHLDGNPSNNRLNNLAWGTPKENMADRKLHGRGAEGSKSARAKLTEENIPDIRRIIASGKRGVMTVAAKKYGVDVATIRDIRDGKTWRHVPV